MYLLLLLQATKPIFKLLSKIALYKYYAHIHTHDSDITVHSFLPMPAVFSRLQ